MSWRTRSAILRDTVANAVSTRQLHYIVEPANWIIQEIGQTITSQLNQAHSLTARVSTSTWGINQAIVHFGSLHTMLWRNGTRYLHSSNKTIGTIWHIIPGASRNQHIPELADSLGHLHTGSSTTKQQLLTLGVPEHKISVIPLGVNLDIFRPGTPLEREQLRRNLHIPPNRTVIGSFQKDGVGWEAGDAPKHEKGPDVFLKVVTDLSKQFRIHVLLVGPARGFVSKGLTANKIPFTNVGYLPRHADIAQYYRALDLYLITSRIEGGPAALLEAWASGIPVVTTNVGLVPDLARHQKTALITPPENTEALTDACAHIISGTIDSHSLTKQALAEVTSLSWSRIAQRYYHDLYQPLL